MGILEYILDNQRLGAKKYRKLLICGFSLVAVSVLLGFLFFLGIERYPFLIILFGISFAIVLGLIFIMLFIYSIFWNIHMLKHHRSLWIKSFWLLPSIRERVKVSNEIRSLNDTFLNKISIWLNRLGLAVFWAWLVGFILTVVIVLLLDVF